MLLTVTKICFILLIAGVAIVDAKTTIIPDLFHFGILGVAAVNFLATDPIFSKENIVYRLIGAVIISLPMLIICFIIPGAFGGGDIKLMAVSGLFLGFKLTLLAAFIAILSGGAWGAGLLILKKADKKDHFAFGPFLCAGMAISLFWGEAIIKAYLAVFGL